MQQQVSHEQIQIVQKHLYNMIELLNDLSQTQKNKGKYLSEIVRVGAWLKNFTIIE